MNLVNCFKPVRIYNKYIDEYVHVPCRKCPACRNNKTMDMVNRLQFEASKYRYGIFFTLTYAPEFVPHYNICYDEQDNGFDISFYRENSTLSKDFVGHSIEEWYNSDGENYEFFRLSEFPEAYKDKDTLNLLTNVLRADGRFNVVSRSHARQFVKRLKYHLKKFYNEELRYYLVSEYGCDKTNNYRPHYHGLLFFNSQQVSKDAYKIVSSCWQLGFVATSPPRGKAYGYVAKYVNSLNYYPAIYDITDARPFSLYSRNPAIGVFEDADEKIKEIFFEQVNDIVFYTHTAVSAVPFWCSLESRVFPRCREFSKISHLDRVARYSFLPEYDRTWSKEYYQEKVLKDLTDEQLRDFYIAKRVNKMCTILGVSVDAYVSRIESYYNHKAMLSLCNFYEYQYDLLSKKPHEWHQLLNLYPEALHQFRDWLRERVKKGRFSTFDLRLTDDLFKKFDPYFKMSSVSDLRQYDDFLFDLDISSEYNKFVDKSNKIEKDSVKTKKVNSIKNVI